MVCNKKYKHKNLEKSFSSIPRLKACKLEKSMLSCGKLFQVGLLIIRSAKNGPCSTAGMWFEYFICMTTCDTRDSELKKVRRTEVDKAKYYFITPD